jgi:hypothetical protein
LSAIKARNYVFDFARHGGAVDTHELTQWTGGEEKSGPSGGVIPAGSVVVGAIARVLEDCTGDATTTLGLVVPGLTTPAALDDVDPATLDAGEAFYWAPSAGAVTPLAADDNPQAVIGVEALTAGKIEVTVLYVEF